MQQIVTQQPIAQVDILSNLDDPICRAKPGDRFFEGTYPWEVVTVIAQPQPSGVLTSLQLKGFEQLTKNLLEVT